MAIPGKADLPGFRKVGRTPVIPVSFKIVLFFLFFILVSNLVSNHITLVFDRTEQVYYSKQLLVKDLKSLFGFCNIQWEIAQLNNDRQGALNRIRKRSQADLENDSSVFMGIHRDGRPAFYVGPEKDLPEKMDAALVQEMKRNLENGIDADFFNGKIGKDACFGVYKYNDKWDFFLFRGEDHDIFFEASRRTFRHVVWIIFSITLAATVAGIFVFRHLLRYIGIITRAIMEMGEKKPVMLFTDIRGFTGMTEVLGLDVITLINRYYDRGIQEIVSQRGIIASIIGDALLALFGVMPERPGENKSLAALQAAWRLHGVIEDLHREMSEKKQELEARKGDLSPEAQQVFDALTMDIGVGIDGGDVFYGTIGSHIRMTSTVIGDRVNAASRLEGLTRTYRVPVICSGYIKADVETHVADPPCVFIQIDRVRVKGKREASDIYWPLRKTDLSRIEKKHLNRYQDALDHYVRGDWEQAHQGFKNCNLPMAQEMAGRTRGVCPADWNGVWRLTTK